MFSAFRFFRFFRLMRATTVISRALQAERRLSSTSTFRVVALLTVFLVVVAGAAQATFSASHASAGSRRQRDRARDRWPGRQGE